MVQVTVFLCNYIITKSRMKYITISLQKKKKKKKTCASSSCFSLFISMSCTSVSTSQTSEHTLHSAILFLLLKPSLVPEEFFLTAEFFLFDYIKRLRLKKKMKLGREKMRLFQERTTCAEEIIFRNLLEAVTCFE